MLSTVKVPCDPAQVIVNHVSFRVQLAAEPGAGPVAAAPLAVLARPRARRRRPVVWTGRSAPGDVGARTLVQAVREARAGGGARAAGSGAAGGTTQVLPRAQGDPVTSPVIGPRAPQDAETAPLPRVAPAEPVPDLGDYALGPHALPGGADWERGDDWERGEDSEFGAYGDRGAPGAERRRARGDGRRAYHPGRRMNLGVVLLPLRLLLGFIALSAGLDKLTDPVYFDGGVRGSMVSWLSSLEPWTAAQPLLSFAVAHPVAAGLTVAFTQVTVGVLTLFGLWQRLAAAVGALLSLALLATVSWRSGPAYDTPDVALLAAWSPLVIAGAPVCSLDARLAGEAWRTLGPRAPLSGLRCRVLRRGAVLASVVLGIALLAGSTLGSAVRSSRIATVPDPGEPPRNHLPGQPLPQPRRGDRTTTDATPGQGVGGSFAEDPTGPAGKDPATPGRDPSGPAGSQSHEHAEPPASEGAAGAAPEESAQQTEQTAPETQPAPSSENDGGGGGGAVGATGGTESPAEDSGGEPPRDEEGGSSGSLGTIGGLLD